MKYTVTKDAEAEIEFKGKEGMAGETPRTVVEVRPSDVASPRANATTMMLRMEGWMALAELINHRVAIGRSVARDAPANALSRRPIDGDRCDGTTDDVSATRARASTTRCVGVQDRRGGRLEE